MRKQRNAADSVSVYKGEKLIKTFNSTCGASQFYYPSHEVSYLNVSLKMSKTGKFIDYDKGLTFMKNGKCGKTKQMQAYKVLNKNTKEKFKIPTTTALSKIVNTNKKFYKDLDVWGFFENDMYKVWRA